MNTKCAPLARMMVFLSATLAFALLACAAEPDTSTPRKAALAFANAVESGDMATARKLATGSDEAWVMVKTRSDIIAAMKVFAAAATDKFGGMGKVSGGLDMTISKRFENTDEKIDGDAAALVHKGVPNDPYPVLLKKTAAGWNLDLASLEKDRSNSGMTFMAPVMIKAFNLVAANIKAGKYQSMVEAEAAFVNAVHDGILSEPPGEAPASGPAPQ